MANVLAPICTSIMQAILACFLDLKVMATGPKCPSDVEANAGAEREEIVKFLDRQLPGWEKYDSPEFQVKNLFGELAETFRNEILKKDEGCKSMFSQDRIRMLRDNRIPTKETHERIARFCSLAEMKSDWKDRRLKGDKSGPTGVMNKLVLKLNKERKQAPQNVSPSQNANMDKVWNAAAWHLNKLGQSCGYVSPDHLVEALSNDFLYAGVLRRYRDYRTGLEALI
ncbi:hypothetical protein B0H63DRAFT_519927 [Podospora didyma]|uniref:Uncharacterized protein n=1 Tax=Podospora didyma TaxID=330526 RepID=A0AAE0U4W5_9PEZI|nr:hypothetical protein B0H63DRAFT_519927 [Podospora didyma]